MTPPPSSSSRTSDLAPVAVALEKILGEKVAFHPADNQSDFPKPATFRPRPATPPPPTFHLMENTRFHPGESENDSALARRFAALGDVFVMDAFACAHRAEASVCAVAKVSNETCVGLLVEKEIAALNRVMQNARPPVVGVFGGAKISDKISAVRHLAKRMDAVLVGGGAANTLLLADGIPVGGRVANDFGHRRKNPQAIRPSDSVGRNRRLERPDGRV